MHMARNGFLGGFRRRLRDAVVPTAPPAPPEDNEIPEETRQALRVLGLATDVADLLLTSGASASDVTTTAVRITRAYGLRGVHCDVTYTSITLSWEPRNREPMSTLRVVRARVTDYTRVQRVTQLVEEIETGELTILEAVGRFRRVNHAPHPYRRWVVVVANGGVAIGLGLLWGAHPVVMLITFLATCLIDIALQFLARRRVPTFFQQVVGAAIATSATLLLQWAQAMRIPLLRETQPTLSVTAGIVLLLAGMSVVGAAQDSLDGFYVTASARAFEVMVLTLGIVTGLLLVLRIGTWLGVSVLLTPTAPVLAAGPVQLVVGSMIISASFAVACYASPRAVWVASMLGVLTLLVYLAAGGLGLGEIGSCAIGAVFSAVVARTIAPRLKVPALALIISAIVALMPGSMVYRGVLLLTSNQTSSDTVSGMVVLMTAAGVGLALAAGSSLGTYLTRPMTREFWRRGKIAR